MNDKFLSMTGLCKKAGKIVIGTDRVKSTVKNSKVYLVIMASDTAANTKKDIIGFCRNFKVNYIEVDYTKEKIGNALGFAEVAFYAVTNKNFTKAIENILRMTTENGGSL